jgi:hypothetical protein
MISLKGNVKVSTELTKWVSGPVLTQLDLLMESKYFHLWHCKVNWWTVITELWEVLELILVPLDYVMLEFHVNFCYCSLLCG